MAMRYKYYNKMEKLTVRQVIMISEKQSESLAILKSYDVNVSQFIRQAIKEKLQKDWKGIKEKKEKIICPF
jgi:post-segregation antitoxin (ccd killing protein)